MPRDVLSKGLAARSGIHVVHEQPSLELPTLLFFIPHRDEKKMKKSEKTRTSNVKKDTCSVLKKTAKELE